MEDERERKEQESRARESAADIEGVFLFLFGIIASRAGPHWELTGEEAKRLSYRVARVEQKYGGLLDKYAPEFALLGCIGMIVYPRLLIEAEKAEGKAVKVEVVEDAPDRPNT